MLTKPEEAAFKEQVRKTFEFLEAGGIASFRNCRMVDDDPRDAYVGCTFENERARITVAYSWFDVGAGVAIHLKRDDLPRRSRGIYLEPWIEFSTGGRTKPLVPFFYPGSSRIKPIVDGRKRLFEADDLSGVLSKLAAKLDEHYSGLVQASNEEVLRYQDWFNTHP